MDLTLKSDLYNNLKFNMHKLIFDFPENDIQRLSEVFCGKEEEIKVFLNDFDRSVENQLSIFKEESKIPDVHGRKTLAFIGDSITSDRESFLRVIQKGYKDVTDLEIIDAAVSGDKSDDAVMKFYFRTLNHKPGIVHILIGTNDMRENKDKLGDSCISLAEYQRNLDYMIKILLESKSQIVISTISPVENEGICKRFPEDNWMYSQERIDEANKIIADTAKKYQIKLNDMRPVYKKYSTKDILLQDGLHLNKLGQQLLLRNVWNALEEYL